MKLKNNQLLIFYTTSVLAIIADWFSKNSIDNSIPIGSGIHVINGVLSFAKIYNTGAAFSILENKTILLSIFSIIAVILIINHIMKNYKNINTTKLVGWGLVLGGTFGNLIDRVFLGYVIDFMKLDFINFPIFNLADLFINLGAATIIINMLSGNRQKNESEFERKN